MGATIAGLNTSPMLGVAPNTIPAQTSDELDRLTDDKSDLLETIYVFGGTAAVSSGVFDQLGQWATNVSGLDADTVDGQQSSAFAAADHGHLDLFDSATRAKGRSLVTEVKLTS